MKIETEENALWRRTIIKPWDDPIASDVLVITEKRDIATGTRINHTYINISGWKTDAANARLWAEAILKACEIAERNGDV